MLPRFSGLTALLILTAAPAVAVANELPDGFVYLDAVAPSIRQDIRYYGTRNFLGQRIEGYRAPRCILTRPAADALAQAQAELGPRALTLKVFDCYRPERAVAHFMRWARQADDPALHALYYPRLSKHELLRQVYIADKSGHSRGSTVDLTIVWADSGPTPAPPRVRGKAREGATEGHDGCSAEAARRDGALDMGSGFDCFDPVSNTADTTITSSQQANRRFLQRLMERHGFRNYEREWWHYTLNREPFPERYFDFPVH